MQDFLDLAKVLMQWEDELPDFVAEVEAFLLDFEVEFNRRVNRNAFKNLLILPRDKYKKVFC